MSPQRELEYILKVQQLRDAGYLEDYLQQKLIQLGLSSSEVQAIMAKSKSQNFALHSLGESIAPIVPDSPKVKRKGKTAPDRFIDSYLLLQRDFAFDVNASLEKLIQAIAHEVKISKMWLHSGRIVSEVYHQQDGTWHLELILTDQNRLKNPLSIARLVGTISLNPDMKTCYLKGTALNLNGGGWFYMFFVLVLGFSFAGFLLNNTPPAPLPVILGILGFIAILLTLIWLTMYFNRNYLIESLQDAVKQAESDA